MGDFQIRCINKPDHASPHERITHIGNGTWRLPIDTAIALIQSKRHTFYTLTPNDVFGLVSRRVDIGVVLAEGGLLGRRAYVRTYADGVWTDNLLALPECSPFAPVVQEPY
jgi:hypothetical protein